MAVVRVAVVILVVWGGLFALAPAKAMVVARVAAVALAVWGMLVVLVLAPSLLPKAWQYYLYSPASTGLWVLAMFVSPFVACFIKWQWIKEGSGRE
ncbi:hypothetical protein [Streptomyces sp. NPDC050504]|uniref:hypothetical protein n=1 Tax=Streptomyces sp. NPDC050504 TaxID=3365618 RepID=UPI0037B9A15F